MEITRNKYLDELKLRMHNGLVKVITGMRRSGKSYLMNEIFYRYLLNSGVPQNHIIRFAFDSANDLALIGEDLLDIDFQKRKVDPHKFMSYITTRIIDDNQYYLLLDEVQNLGSAGKPCRFKSCTGHQTQYLCLHLISKFANEEKCHFRQKYSLKQRASYANILLKKNAVNGKNIH